MDKLEVPQSVELTTWRQSLLWEPRSVISAKGVTSTFKFAEIALRQDCGLMIKPWVKDGTEYMTIQVLWFRIRYGLMRAKRKWNEEYADIEGGGERTDGVFVKSLFGSRRRR
jgi:hypothetical protein